MFFLTATDLSVRTKSVTWLLHCLERGLPTAGHLSLVLAEMEGRAFLLRWARAVDQEAWDACSSADAMFRAVGAVRCTGAVRAIAHAITRFREMVLDCTEPALAAVVETTTPTESIGETALRLMSALAQVVDAEVAEDALCEMVRRYLPVAPFGFAGMDRFTDGQVLDLAAEAELTASERVWVAGLRDRLYLAGCLTRSQREKVDLLVRRCMAWVTDHDN